MNHLLCLTLLSFAACGQAPKPPAPVEPASTAQLVADRQAYYPRLLQLANGPEKGNLLLSFDNDGTAASLFHSPDGGKTWTLRADLADTTRPGHCCSGLWEVPQKLGSTEPGTLFWTTSVGRGRDPRTTTAMNLFQSTDFGKTWSLLSTPVRGSVGLWEAEFIVDAIGQLVMYYSTEEHRAANGRGESFNQLLAHKISADGGNTWGPEVRDVAVPDLPDKKMRPGMAIVRRLTSGRYVMTYEICGLNCDTYIRFSENGTDWGNPADAGTRVESTAGHHVSHAPTITVLPDERLAVIGQMLYNRDGSLANGNGTVYFVGDGTGPWTEHPAPVSVPEAADNPCPNYSSQLLPLPDGTLLEVALKPLASGCRAFVGRGALPSR